MATAGISHPGLKLKMLTGHFKALSPYGWCSAAGISKGQLDNALQSVRGSGASVDTDTADQKFEALQKYGTDLTAKAAQLDPIIGRDEEIRRCVRILCRRTKNNPVLIGDPGKGQAQSVLRLKVSPFIYAFWLPLMVDLQDACPDAKDSDNFCFDSETAP